MHRRVLDHLRRRLLAGVTRSALLKATVPRSGRLVDCSCFESVDEGLSVAVLQRVMDGHGSIEMELRLRFTHSDVEHSGEDDEEERRESRDDKIVREQRAMYDALDRRLRRFAELVRRETGVHSLWLGYPLLYVVVDHDDTKQWILAPVFLWPVSIQLDRRHEGRVLVARDRNAGPAKFNRAMAAWVSRQLNFAVDGPDQNELDKLSRDDLGPHLAALAGQFRDLPDVNWDAPMEPIPNVKLLNSQQGSRFYNSGVLGIFRWHNEAILADIEKLKDVEQINGACSGFVSGRQLPRSPNAERPAETDRFEVYDADFSQERIIWQCRSEPGVVVHGPPGTGKSQTIVNIIADALAHGRTVLMVCQKYAATRIVFEKLKMAGLDALCIQATDTEKGRLPTFHAIRNQVDSLPTQPRYLDLFDGAPSSKRERLASEITQLEDDLDQYARAMHQLDARIELAYREMKSMEGRIWATFPTVRPLPSLQACALQMSASELEVLSPHIKEAGRLFGLGEPLANPWRFHQPRIQPTPALKSDVQTAIGALRHSDSQHMGQVTSFGGGISIEGELEVFKKVASDVLPRLRVIAQNPNSLLGTVYRIWLFFGKYQHPWLQRLLRQLVASESVVCRRQLADGVDQALKRLPVVAAIIENLDSLHSYLKPEAFAEPDQLVRSGTGISSWLKQLELGFDGLQPLMAWGLLRENRREPLNLMVGALEEYERRRKAGDNVPVVPADMRTGDYGEWWLALVRYSVALAWQDECHQKHPILLTMTSELHAEKAGALQRLLAEKRALEAEVIRTRWLSEQARHRTAPWKRMYQLRRSKYGDAKRLREAVKLSLREGLLAMRPCWLVNPATAAEIFPLEEGLFDLVIFDEASQCPLEQAVPAIYRGKTVVVSGDEKQLPPTSFFASSWDIEECEDENAQQRAIELPISRQDQLQSRPTSKAELQRLSVNYLLQVEDLLSAAIGNLPERYLSVHYRSRHPALIEFSNRAFYNGRLEAPPPQVSTRDGYAPIRYHKVNGLYDRRTNEDEGRYVVNLLSEIWKSRGKCPTLGVVTFNQPQRDLIEDLLEEECFRDAAFHARYQQEVAREEDNQDAGLFIKNLENVQGDERDVMIFSTTFGRDAQGRFYRRFGPVGALEGERRLNVAVTRAKQQVIVVSSMPIEEISNALSRDAAPGSQLTPACYLQLYLAYAKAVSEGDAQQIERILDRVGRKSSNLATGTPESPLEEDVREVIQKLGFTVCSQVGESGFRIDLGVLAPNSKDGYLLGIECDGAAYHSDRSARLRDAWRERILRGRGWRLHRIWSTRWWYERGDETERLKAALEASLNQLGKVPTEHVLLPESAAEARKARDRTWEEYLADLTQFKKENNDCDVPPHWYGDPELSSWVADQRSDWMKGTLTGDRFWKLYSLGFKFPA